MSDAAFDIAAGGMAAQRSAMDRIAENLAGVPGSRSQGGDVDFGGNAYVPASFTGALDDALSLADVSDVGEPVGVSAQWSFAVASPLPQDDSFEAAPSGARTPSAGAARSEPDPIGQMIALIAAGRAYDADVAALQAAKQMDVEASDIDKY